MSWGIVGSCENDLVGQCFRARRRDLRVILMPPFMNPRSCLHAVQSGDVRGTAEEAGANIHVQACLFCMSSARLFHHIQPVVSGSFFVVARARQNMFSFFSYLFSNKYISRVSGEIRMNDDGNMLGVMT